MMKSVLLIGLGRFGRLGFFIPQKPVGAGGGAYAGEPHYFGQDRQHYSRGCRHAPQTAVFDCG